MNGEMKGAFKAECQVLAFKERTLTRAFVNKFRAEILTKFCDSHNLDFHTGMGCYFVSDVDNNMREVKDYSNGVDEALNHIVGGRKLWEWLEDYNPLSGYKANNLEKFRTDSRNINNRKRQNPSSFR